MNYDMMQNAYILALAVAMGLSILLMLKMETRIRELEEELDLMKSLNGVGKITKRIVD